MTSYEDYGCQSARDVALGGDFVVKIGWMDRQATVFEDTGLIKPRQSAGRAEQ